MTPQSHPSPIPSVAVRFGPAVGVVNAVCALLVIILFAAAMTLHIAALTALALPALVACLLLHAVTGLWRAWRLARTGSWMDLQRRVYTRAETPGRYRLFLVSRLVHALVLLGLAALLALAWVPGS